MKNYHLHKFIESIDGFSNLKQIDQIIWFIFFQIEIRKKNYVTKEKTKSLFATAWVSEPKNFDQLWNYLAKKKKILIKQGNGFVLDREKYKGLKELYLQPLIKKQGKKGLKQIGKSKNIIIPPTVLKLLPKDVIRHCTELNDNIKAENWIASMLLMRKILPLVIIRKFQKDNKDSNIKDSKGEYFGTEKLLEKSKNLIQPRIYKELKEIKFLFDSIQHIFTFSPNETDISPATIRLRVFLEDLFK